MALDRADRDAIVEAITAGFNTSAKSANPGPGFSGDKFPGGNILMKAAEGVFKGAEKVINKGGGRIADTVDGFGKAGSALGTLIGYVENTNDVFQSLSKVGAGFDADLGALRQSAAQTRMPLAQFAGMISQNTAELAGFSGGVNAGAKRFTELSYAMFDSNLIENFMDLGMTVEESNEFLMKNMAFDRRRARLEGMTDQQQIQSALDLAKSMDVMAKITGKSVQEQQDSLKDRMREGATQAKLRLLEKDGVTGASTAYKQAQSALEGSPKVVGDLLADLTQTGVPMTQATKNFAATNKEAYALLQQSANATKRGDVATAEKLAQQAAAATAKFADSRQGLTLSTLASVNEIAQGQADRLEEVGPIIDQIASHSDKLAKELGRTPSIFETYNDMLSEAVDTQTAQTGGTLPGQDAQQSVREGQLGLANVASTFNEELGKAMSSSTVAQGIFDGMTKFITEGAKVIGNTAAAGINLAAGETLADVKNNVTDPEIRNNIDTLNSPTATADEKQKAQSFLIDAKILSSDGKSLNTTVVNDIFEKARERNNENLATSPINRDENDSFLNNFKELLFGRDDDVVTPSGGDKAIGGGVTSGTAYRVGEQGPETFLAGMDGAIIPNMKAMLNRMPDIAKTMQDEMAQFGTPMSKMAQEASAQMQNSTSVEQKLDILNQTMLQLVNINSVQARTGEKQLKGLRHTGNLMSGLGRA
jgi:hypothetical protein